MFGKEKINKETKEPEMMVTADPIEKQPAKGGKVAKLMKEVNGAQVTVLE